MRSKNRSIVIENASIVTPSEVLENASLRVSDGTIAELNPDDVVSSDQRLDAQGMYVLPGLIDLHSDAIESEVQPRPGAVFPINIAVFEMDKKLAASGITTMYHAVSMIDNRHATRNKDVADKIIREINRLALSLNVRTLVHARFDLPSADTAPYVERLIDDGCVHLFSIMDHTPGQGQFQKITAYSKDYMQKNGFDEATISSEIERWRAAPRPLDADYVGWLIKKCHDRSIPIASHDDDSEEKLDIVEKMGSTISEFPVNMETVTSAAARGMYVALGSPNIVRGSSISGNLSAREAIQAGYGDILCSDYAPMSIIHAVFAIEHMGIPLHKAVNMASLNPAKAAGISGFTGSLEPGKSADLIIVDPREEVHRVLKTYVQGKEVYSAW